MATRLPGYCCQENKQFGTGKIQATLGIKHLEGWKPNPTLEGWKPGSRNQGNRQQPWYQHYDINSGNCSVYQSSTIIVFGYEHWSRIFPKGFGATLSTGFLASDYWLRLPIGFPSFRVNSILWHQPISCKKDQKGILSYSSAIPEFSSLVRYCYVGKAIYFAVTIMMYYQYHCHYYMLFHIICTISIMLYYDIFCMFLYYNLYNDLLYIHIYIYIFRDILYHMFVYIYIYDWS